MDRSQWAGMPAVTCDDEPPGDAGVTCPQVSAGLFTLTQG